MHAVWGTEGDQHANLILNLYISKEFSFQFQWNPMKCFSQSFSVKVDHSNNPQRSFKSEYILKLPEYQVLKWCMTNTSQEYSIFTFAFIVMSLFRSLKCVGHTQYLSNIAIQDLFPLLAQNERWDHPLWCFLWYSTCVLTWLEQLGDKTCIRQEGGAGKILYMIFAKLFNNTDEQLYLLYIRDNPEQLMRTDLIQWYVSQRQRFPNIRT